MSKISYPFTVRAYQTGPGGELHVHQLANFLQEAAHYHADGLGFGQEQLVKEGLFWVLSRLAIRIDSMPQRGAELTLTTWVSAIKGMVTERSFVLYNGEQEVARALSVWFCLAADSQRPVHLPSQYTERMPLLAEAALPGGVAKVPPVGDEARQGASFTARHSDIDMVDHVNNTVYLRWAFDDWLSDHPAGTLTGLQVNFLDQCFLGDQVTIYTGSSGDQRTVVHEVREATSGKVLCRLQSHWQ